MQPDTWILVDLYDAAGIRQCRKVFGGKYGVDIVSDSWVLSSEIIGKESNGCYSKYVTKSWNDYTCFDSCYGMSINQEVVLESLNAELAAENLGKLVPVQKEWVI
jgi:hypothetical protein